MLLLMGFVSVSGFGTKSHAPHHGRRGKGGLAARGENGRARLHPCGGGRACGNGASRFSIFFLLRLSVFSGCADYHEAEGARRGEEQSIRSLSKEKSLKALALVSRSGQ
jgi:hypothetical protein